MTKMKNGNKSDVSLFFQNLPDMDSYSLASESFLYKFINGF